MIDLLRAEWRKMAGNRWVAGLLVWIFPVGAVALSVVLLLFVLFSDQVRAEVAASPLVWTDQAVAAVGFLNNQFGRLFFIAFAVVVFAGEYQWGTWKNIVPRSRRTRLILAKLLTLGVFILTALLLMALFWVLGRIVVTLVAGGSVTPTLSNADLGSFGRDLLLQAAVAYAAVLIVSSQAALVAMLLRSVIWGMLVGVGVTLVEPLLLVIAFVATQLFERPAYSWILRVTPMYNLDNITSWITFGNPTSMVQLMSSLGEPLPL